MVRSNVTRQSSGFTSGHISLIAVSAAALLLVAWFTEPTTLQTFLTKQAEADAAPATYEQARAKALEMQQASAVSDNSASARQLAELDSDYGKGEVLGASTEAIPDPDQLITEEKINAIKINEIADDSGEAAERYAAEIRFVETAYDVPTMLVALNSREQTALKKVNAQYSGLLGELQAMKVPAGFGLYHKYKLIYYSSLATMSGSYDTAGAAEEVSTAATLFFSLNDKLEILRAELSDKYGVKL